MKRNEVVDTGLYLWNDILDLDSVIKDNNIESKTCKDCVFNGFGYDKETDSMQKICLELQFFIYGDKDIKKNCPSFKTWASYIIETRKEIERMGKEWK